MSEKRCTDKGDQCPSCDGYYTHRYHLEDVEADRDLWKSKAEKLAKTARNVEDMLEVNPLLGASSQVVCQKAIDDFREALAQFEEGKS